MDFLEQEYLSSSSIESLEPHIPAEAEYSIL